MANETLKYCDLGPAILGEEKFRELNGAHGGVGGASDLGPAFLSPPEPETLKNQAGEAIDGNAEAPGPTPKPAAKKRAR